jgi:hypothetical protein
MTWICPIPGASASTATLHFALHLGLLAFVLVAGTAFLGMAVIAYRRPVTPALEDAYSGA